MVMVTIGGKDEVVSYILIRNHREILCKRSKMYKSVNYVSFVYTKLNGREKVESSWGESRGRRFI